MKILVLSDSHSALSFMRRCVQAVKPDAVIHLGDYFADGKVIAGENPNLPFFQVPGNCDAYRSLSQQPEILECSVCGVRLYMTHGHKHGVKSGIERLLRAARESGAQGVLYGHTHVTDCHQEADGLWVLNPGACGFFGGTAGLIETEQYEITACKILRQADLEDML